MTLPADRHQQRRRVYDTGTYASLGNLTTGATPYGIALNGNTAYVANYTFGTVTYQPV